MRKMRTWLAIIGVGMCLMTAAFPQITAYAETEPTFEGTDVTPETEAYVGVVVDTDDLNVRTGCGTDYDRIMVNGEYVILYKGDKVAVVGTGLSKGGRTWYEVRWMEDGVKYHGYVSGTFLKVTEERANPLPTPTPEPTATPIPTPTPEPTIAPTQAPTQTPAPTEAPEEEGGFSILKGIGVVVLLLLVAAGGYVFFMMKKREAAGAETAEKIDSLKNIQLKKGPENENGNPINVMRRRQEVAEDVKETSAVRPQSRTYESDAAILARKEHARQLSEEIMEKSRFYDPSEEKKKEDELKQLSESLKEKELLKEEIENLSPGDLVYHEYFGKGVVFDNSDVKRIEIRFGTDVRFVDKAACVAKKLMRKV